MGCDIHVFLYHKNSITNEYEPIKLFVQKVNKKNNEKYYENVSWQAPWCNRDYTLFSLLAGVRGAYDELNVGCHGIFDSANFDNEMLEESEWCFSPKWFDWRDLYMTAKCEGEVEQDFTGEKYNPVLNWMEKLNMLCECNQLYPNYGEYKPGDIIIQIMFDN